MTALPPLTISEAELRAALRRGAGEWIRRFYRHQLDVARAVRGMEGDSAAAFDRQVVQPVLREVAGRLSTFDLRGQTIVLDAYPQLREMMASVQAIVDRGTEAVRAMTVDSMHRVAKVELRFAASSAKKALDITPQSPVEAMVLRAVDERPFLGLRTEEWFDKMLAGPTGDKTRQFIQLGLQRGLTETEIVRGLRGTKQNDYQDGILTGASTRAVETLVRTASTHASNVARMESFAAIGVAKWRFLATLDLKTCPRCRAADGRVFPLNQGPIPPLHPNTRSTAVPYFGDPIGTRASVDGQVPAEVDHEEWLRGLSTEEQDQALGRRVAVAWRAGRLDYQDLIGPDMEPLTMRELEQRNLIAAR